MIAAVAVAFAKYLGVFFPSLNESFFLSVDFTINYVQLVSVLIILFLTIGAAPAA